MEASIRTPKEVIALVSPDKADEIERRLVKTLQSVSAETHRVLIMVENDKLIWGTQYYK